MNYTDEDKKRLADYIKKQTKSGFDITTIRNFLISNRYSSSLVDASIDSIYGNSNIPKSHIPKKSSHKLIAIAVLSLIIIIGLTFGLIKFFDEDRTGENSNNRIERTPLGSQNDFKKD